MVGGNWLSLGVTWFHVLGVRGCGNKSYHVTGCICRDGGGPQLWGVTEEGSLLGAWCWS